MELVTSKVSCELLSSLFELDFGHRLKINGEITLGKAITFTFLKLFLEIQAFCFINIISKKKYRVFSSTKQFTRKLLSYEKLFEKASKLSFRALQSQKNLKSFTTASYQY